MSRTLTANAQAQANAQSARPFNVLEIELDSPLPASNCWHWLMDEGTGDYAHSNDDDDDKRIDKTAGQGTSEWVDGKYGKAVTCTNSAEGWDKWGSIPPAGLGKIQPDSTICTVGYWWKANTDAAWKAVPVMHHNSRISLSGNGFRINVYDGGVPTARIKSISEPDRTNWHHYVVKWEISGGHIYITWWRDGVKQVDAEDLGTADSFQEWQYSYFTIWIAVAYRILGNQTWVDELFIAKDWDITQDDVDRIFTAATVASKVRLSDCLRTIDKQKTIPCVTDWGRVSLPGSRIGSQQDGALFPLADYSPRLHLAAEDLRGLFLGASPPIHRKATLYQFWDDEAVSWPDDAVKLYEGTLGSIAGGAAQEFRDRDVTISLNIIDRFKTLLDTDVGFIASKDVFDDVLEADEGRAIPLVYGKAKKVRAVCVKGPQVGGLMQGCSKDDTTLYIEGGEKFPQGQVVVVRIGYEYLKGTFSGNTFSVVKRGCGPSADGSYVSLSCTGHVTDQEYGVDFRKLTISSPPGINDQYVGLWLGAPVGAVYQAGEVTFQTVSPGNPYIDYLPPQLAPHDSLQWRQILHYDAENGKVEVNLPYLREDKRTLTADDRYLASGVQVIMQNGATLKIGSLPAPHRAGVEVYEVLDECTYALNAAPSKALKAVYFRGLKGEWRLPSDYTDNLLDAGGGLLGMVNLTGSGGLSFSQPSAPSGDAMHAGAWSGLIGAVFPSDEADFQEIPTAFYSTNLDDDAWNDNLGTDITTVTFKMLPVHVPYFRPDGLEIWADIEGVADDQDNLLENPADVIEDILVNRVGVDSGLVDGTSFSAAKSSTNWIRFAGPVERRMSGRRLVSEVAFQARCRLRFETGKVYLDYLKNAPGTPVSPDVTKSLAVEDRLELHWEDPGEAINEVEFTWRDEERRPRAERVTVDESIDAFGRRQVSASFYLHQTYAQAKQVAAFWVNRWAWPWRRGALRGLLPFLPFERGDTIEITNADWSLDEQKAEVLDIAHRPGAAGLMDEVAVAFRLPLRLGCDSSCETYCETGCETDCENWCQSACELSCEDACQAACQSLCELACQTVVQQMNGGGCFACQVGNRVGIVDGVGPRDDWEEECAGCQTCQGSCVDSCQAGCESACQDACTAGPACETTCEVGACEVQCETGCETSCEVTCESGPCETACETPNCQTNCEVYGQCGDCQASGCEGPCQSTCQTTCQQSCQGGSCTVGSCETACEEGNCEVSCEVGGCELACEVGQQ